MSTHPSLSNRVPLRSQAHNPFSAVADQRHHIKYEHPGAKQRKRRRKTMGTESKTISRWEVTKQSTSHRPARNTAPMVPISCSTKTQARIRIAIQDGAYRSLALPNGSGRCPSVLRQALAPFSARCSCSAQFASLRTHQIDLRIIPRA